MKTQLEAIRNIDPAAAEYIETVVLTKYPAAKLKRLFPENTRWFRFKCFFVPHKKTDIFDLFFWKLTPQGRVYWIKIWRELNVE